MSQKLAAKITAAQAVDMTQGNPRVRTADLFIGQRVDLENDRYADPEGFRGVETSHPEFAFEFETVIAIERETAECTRVDFESGFSCGFPPDHLVDIDGEQTFPEPLTEARHDMHGYYLCTAAEAAHEDSGYPSVGFDGRQHWPTLEAAQAALSAAEPYTPDRWPVKPLEAVARMIRALEMVKARMPDFPAHDPDRAHADYISETLNDAYAAWPQFRKADIK